MRDFSLAAQAKQNEIVLRKDGVDDLRHHGFFVAQDATKEGTALFEAGNQVAAELVLDRKRALASVGRRAKRTEGFWQSGHGCVMKAWTIGASRPETCCQTGSWAAVACLDSLTVLSRFLPCYPDCPNVAEGSCAYWFRTTLNATAQGVPT